MLHAALLALLLPGPVSAKSEAAPLRYYVGPRVRYITLPSFLLSGVYDAHTKLANGSYGLEFARRRLGVYDLVLGLDYTDLSSEPGYWRRNGDPLNASSYTVNGMGLVGFDASFYWNAEVNERLAFFGGLGLGLGFTVGEVITTEPCLGADGRPDLSRKCDDPLVQSEVGELPPVLPVLNLAAGLRLTFDGLVSKLEVGFRDALFVGLGLGYEWAAGGGGVAPPKSR